MKKVSKIKSIKIESIKIKSIKAREILDSRGSPTVEVELKTDNGIFVDGMKIK